MARKVSPARTPAKPVKAPSLRTLKRHWLEVVSAIEELQGKIDRARSEGSKARLGEQMKELKSKGRKLKTAITKAMNAAKEAAKPAVKESVKRSERTKGLKSEPAPETAPDTEESLIKALEAAHYNLRRVREDERQDARRGLTITSEMRSHYDRAATRYRNQIKDLTERLSVLKNGVGDES